MIDFEKVQQEIKNCLDEYIYTWSKKENKNKACLDEWKTCVIQKVRDRINVLKRDKKKFVTKSYNTKGSSSRWIINWPFVSTSGFIEPHAWRSVQ